MLIAASKIPWVELAFPLWVLLVGLNLLVRPIIRHPEPSRTAEDLAVEPDVGQRPSGVSGPPPDP